MNVIDNGKIKLCNYKNPFGEPCKRPVPFNSDLCFFHTLLSSKRRVNYEKFSDELNHLIAEKDGQWNGFIFPENFAFKSAKFDFPINLKFAVFKELTIEDCEFHKPVTFYKSQFLGKVSVRCSFFDKVNLNGCIFNDSVSFRGTRNVIVTAQSAVTTSSVGNVTITTSDNHIIEEVSKENSDKKILNWIKEFVLVFINKFMRLLNKSRIIILNIFKQTKKFNKWFKTFYKKLSTKDVQTSEEIRRVFFSEVELTEVEFRYPERVVFYLVDFSKMRLVGTNFRGVNLHDILWPESKSKRKVIFDEITMKRTNDLGYINRMRPRVEEAYRNLRLALEDIKDFSTASDFYVGEMETKRSQKSFWERYFFSVEVWYRYLSNYGTNVFLSFKVLALLLLIHMSLTFWNTYDNSVVMKAFGFSEPANWIIQNINIVLAYFINSLKVLMFRSEKSYFVSGEYQIVIDIFFRIIGYIQLVLVALTMRSKVKRY